MTHDFRDMAERRRQPERDLSWSPAFFLVIQGLTFGLIFWACLL
jgi:hypothetical protein